MIITRAYISFVFLGICVTTATGCAGKAREAVYSAYEKVGIQKRDLLKKRITVARDDQKQASETFTDALDKLRAVYTVDGGELEKRYDKLKSSYDKATSDANNVHNSIDKVETVAGDLFQEWDKEDAEIQAADLRAKSQKQLVETKRRYADMIGSLKQSESRMQPILAAFKDQVLFMKHNLNARAIASLKGESVKIEQNINLLIERMNKSIKDADDFIARLP